MKKLILFIMFLLFLSVISFDKFQDDSLNFLRRLKIKGNVGFYQTVQNILADLERRIVCVDKMVVFDELRRGYHGRISWKELQDMFTEEDKVIAITDVPVDEEGIIRYSTNMSNGTMFQGQFQIRLDEEYAKKEATVLFSKDKDNSMTALRVEVDGEVVIDETMVAYIVSKDGMELCFPPRSNNVLGAEPFREYFYFRSFGGDNVLYIINQRLSPKGGFILFGKTSQTILSDRFSNALVAVKVEREPQSNDAFRVTVVVVEDQEGRPVLDKFGKPPVYYFYGFLREGRMLSYFLELVKGPEL